MKSILIFFFVLCHHRRTGNGNESGLMIIMPSRAASEDLFCFSGGGRGLFLKEKRHNFREIDFTKKRPSM